MKRNVSVLLLVALLLSMLVMPVSAYAATKVKILKVTADGARVRRGPGNYEVVVSVKKGSKVFYLGKTTNSFAHVRTAYGKTGYMYKGFLKSYGSCYLSQVYCSKKSSVSVYKSPSTRSKRVTKLSKRQHVVVYQVKGSWAYIKTLGGTGGFVKKSNLKKAS
ncbi:MAG: SH3 domain-containing protein [Clostridia bacterium]|nr:SH3 domain-containing protein [Clostridia bacterium]